MCKICREILGTTLTNCGSFLMLEKRERKRREESEGKKREKNEERREERKAKGEKKWNRKRRRAKRGGWAEIRSVLEVRRVILSVTFCCSESIYVETKVA